MASGPIDPHSEYSLHDVVEGTMPEPDEYGDRPHDHPTTEFYGLHITHLGDGRHQITYDGHVGRMDTFYSDEYDDVLELVDDLVFMLLEIGECSKEELVEWAGKMVTTDEERASENPHLYIHVPEDSPARA